MRLFIIGIYFLFLLLESERVSGLINTSIRPLRNYVTMMLFSSPELLCMDSLKLCFPSVFTCIRHLGIHSIDHNNNLSRLLEQMNTQTLEVLIAKAHLDSFTQVKRFLMLGHSSPECAGPGAFCLLRLKLRDT